MGESDAYAEKDFLECFRQFTEGGCGFITKAEMSIFIKKVAGLNVDEEEAALKEAQETAIAEEEASKLNDTADLMLEKQTNSICKTIISDRSKEVSSPLKLPNISPLSPALRDFSTLSPRRLVPLTNRNRDF